jgi:hypothetical protein
MDAIYLRAITSVGELYYFLSLNVMRERGVRTNHRLDRMNVYFLQVFRNLDYLSRKPSLRIVYSYFFTLILAMGEWNEVKKCVY